ncbi:MAG: alanine racemase [Heliobacteriaceae bacterium]|jgi:alanine racemase|nr:alanine racemase [Heliobacteriaceae bacterium]
MKNVRQSHVNIHRDSWVEINLEYAAHNVKEIRAFLPPGMKFLAVVKADAYGHGSVMLAPTLLASGVDMLGVASIDEGVDLREAKINSEILVLGAVPVWAVESAVKADLTISIFSKEHIESCKRAYERLGVKPKVHIKIDTGMNRIGVAEDEAADFIKEVQAAGFIELQGIFTHFANAENREKTDLQIKKWNKIISQVNTDGLLLHVQNSAGTLCYEVPGVSMVRVGIALYGLLPGGKCTGKCKQPQLKQIMSVKARIVHIHEISAGEGVSYEHSFVASGLRKIATIPVGYADGVPRGLSNKIFGTISPLAREDAEGRGDLKIPQIGNITMDQMMFDLNGVDAQVGDVITILGDINEWALILNTINYTLTCGLKVRLPRVYTR